jgi:hypothetical protein
MKKILLIAMVLAGISTKGQFFQRQYGVSSSNDKLTHGYNTSSTIGYGHFMVGNTFTNVGTTPLLAARTDFTGAPFAAPYFVNTYLINDATNNLVVGNVRSFERPLGAGFGIVGEITGSTNGLAYLVLDASGNVTNIVRHFPSTAGQTVLLANVVLNDITNTDAIAVGTIIDNNFSPAQEYPFAYSFDIATGAINWSNYYDHATGFSPQTNVRVHDCNLVPSTPLLGIVGKSTSPGLTIGNDAFYMLIDITGGFWLAPSVVCDWGANEDLTAIHFSTNTGLFGVCGNFDFFGQDDVLTMLLTPPPSPPIFGTVMQYNNIFGNITNVAPADIYTRTNTAGMAEFYVAGTATDGNLLRTDAVVYKLDVNLNPVGQFTYGNQFAGSGVSIDGYDNTGTCDGLSTFANYTPTAASLNQDYHLIKSYYNGQSGCNEDLQVPFLQSIPPPASFPIPTAMISNIMSMSTGLNVVSNPFPTLSPLCYNTSISGGSNAKVAPADDEKDRAVKLSPNPMAQGTAVMFMEVSTEVPVDVDVAIYDMLGRQFYNGKQSLSSGDNRLPINVSDANMVAGTYVVKITGIDFNKNITLLVK